jgi:hypothetical protein
MLLGLGNLADLKFSTAIQRLLSVEPEAESEKTIKWSPEFHSIVNLRVEICEDLFKKINESLNNSSNARTETTEYDERPEKDNEVAGLSIDETIAALDEDIAFEKTNLEFIRSIMIVATSRLVTYDPLPVCF